MSSEKKLNLSKENVQRAREYEVQVPATPEEAAILMAKFNQAQMDAQLNIVALLSDIAESLRLIEMNTSDTMEYLKKALLKSGHITEVDIIEQEGDDGDDGEE